MPIFDDLELTWFDAGSGIFDRSFDDPNCYPPLDDREAQREWLAGFVGAWGEHALCAPPTVDVGEDVRQRPVREVLAHRLANRPVLLRQLLEIGATNKM